MISKEASELPEGRLVNKGNFYYLRTANKDIGITKNITLIKKLCRKKFLQNQKKQIENNLNVIKGKTLKFDDRTPREIVAELPHFYIEFPDDYFFHPSVEKWKNITYLTNQYKKENLIYVTNAGINVRSKSEQMISNILFDYGIPYRYEPLIVSDGKRYYPDFWIKNPYTGNDYLLEHFGLLQSSDYSENMNDKMSFYRSNGYVVNENILYTFESDVRDINHLRKLIIEFIYG